MEIVVLLAGLCALGILAARFGHDSRDTANAKERELASLGVVWEESSHRYLDTELLQHSVEFGLAMARVADYRREAAHWRLTQRASGLSLPIRHRLALVLRRTAAWLYPDVGDGRPIPPDTLAARASAAIRAGAPRSP